MIEQGPLTLQHRDRRRPDDQHDPEANSVGDGDPRRNREQLHRGSIACRDPLKPAARPPKQAVPLRGFEPRFCCICHPYRPHRVFQRLLLHGKPLIDNTGAIFLRLGWSGYTLYLLSLLGAILILMNLERTLRYSTGRTRWQVKFMVFGIASLFGIRVYTDSQVLLYRVLSTDLEVVKAGVLLLADGLVVISLSRARLLKFDFYVSHTLLYNSFSLLLVGVYFIVVGVMARLFYYWKGAASIPIVAFLLFLAIIGLSLLFLSDQFSPAPEKIHQPPLQAPILRLPAGLG